VPGRTEEERAALARRETRRERVRAALNTTPALAAMALLLSLAFWLAVRA
jgi:hypothetical protein